MILDRIVSLTRDRIAEEKNQIPLAEFEHALDLSEPTRDFCKAIRGDHINIIAEIKRASPSRGWLCRDLRVGSVASEYAKAGAAAISVLTEPSFFKGSLEDLEQARGLVNIPLLRKDFVLDSYQLFQARSYGADAVLLIAAILSARELKDFIDLTQQLSMSALVEVHNEAELMTALEAGASLVGINNRDLTDFSVDIATTLRLLPLVPPGVTVVSESGISSRDEVRDLDKAGVHAILVGETLVMCESITAKIVDLLGWS